jgi:succinate-semialdehyde dehydrogenase/glutarate-semialdehyde dehydrogenase
MSNQLPVQLASPSLFESRGFFAGQWRDPASGNLFPVTEPSSGQTLAYCSNFAEQDFIEAIENADQGFRQYFFNTTAKQRSSLLRKWHELILENAEDR